MIYILVALALFGILTAVLARRGAQSDNENLTAEMAQFESAQVLAYAQSAQKSVDQMLMGGITPDDIDFSKPNDASYELGRNIYKLFHPEGGGLIYKPADPKLFDTTTNPEQGFYIGMFNSVEWTPTTAHDIIFTAHFLKQPICAAINEKITGSSTIPAFDTNNAERSLVSDDYHNINNSNFLISDCTACENMAMLCVSNTGATGFMFYSIIEAR